MNFKSNSPCPFILTFCAEMVVVSMVCQSGNGIAPNVGEISKEKLEGKTLKIVAMSKKNFRKVLKIRKITA